MTTPAFGHHTLFLTRCENSMNWGKRIIADTPHGTFLHAAHHGTVRGRQGRSWQVMAQQLLLTFIVKPNNAAEITTPDTHGATPLMYLYYALNVAICSAIAQFVPECRIKWPNDCILGTQKVAGMLMEPVWNGNALTGVVLGIGINVNNRFERESEMEVLATSMRVFVFRGAFDVEQVRQTVNQQLTAWFDLWENKEYEKIWKQWLQLHVPIGSQFRVHAADGFELTGLLKMLCRNGSITITTQDTDHTLHIGDVTTLQFTQSK